MSVAEVAILGVGMHPWGKWGRNFVEYGVAAARAAMADAGVGGEEVQVPRGGERIYAGGVSGAGRTRSRRTHAPLSGPRLDRPADASWSTWAADASVDGRWLAMATGEEGTVLLWDLEGPVAAEPADVPQVGQIVAFLRGAKRPVMMTRLRGHVDDFE